MMQLPLGQRLKAAREARGLSLADAAHETRVPARRLQFLEADDIAAFGSLAYARSFLKLYSDYLGVDATEALDELPSAHLGGPQDYRYLTNNFGPWLRKDLQVPSMRINAPQTSSAVVQTVKSPVPAGIAIFLFVVALAGLYGQYVATLNDKTTEAPAQSVSAEAVAASEKPILQPAVEAPAVVVPEQVQPAIPVDPLVIAPPSKTGRIELNPGEGL